jgi:hypothetical protein
MSKPSQAHAPKPRCGLCGKTKGLMQTDCCGNWICDDQHKYVLFSYARNSCARNHDRCTLCSFHHQNGHKGHWKDCKVCRKSFATEIYVWYGTNEYNFELLENPPHFEPTHCDRCGAVIKLGTDGYSEGRDGRLCQRCTNEKYYGAAPTPRSAVARKPKPQLPVNPDAGAIEIILSARAQKRWRIKPDLRANEPPAHWLAQWRVDFGQKPDRTWLVLVTNVATLFTFLFPLKDLKPDAFERLFRLRLGFALTDAPALAKWKDAPLVFTTGNPRVAVGSMNGMRKHMAWRKETPDWGPMKDDEDWINKTPYLSLATSFPDKEFAGRLKTTRNT